MKLKVIAVWKRNLLSPPAATGFLALSFLFLAQSGRAKQSQTEKKTAITAANEARQIFESTCAGCHGLDGRGGERGPDIATRPQVVQLPDRELREILSGGRPDAGMPPFAFLGSGKLDALLSYLRFLQGKDAAAVLPGKAANGKALFFGKARCADCHTMQGQGGFLGADLSDSGTALSAREMRRSIIVPAETRNAGKRMTIIQLRDSQQLTGITRNEDNFWIQLQLRDGTFRFVSRSDIASVESSPEPIMPTNYGTVLTGAEIDDLVKYLKTAASSEKKQKQDESEEEE
jgi:cytochrome c oxidase cbb3-type subunit III